jgi:four helix bundle protein
MQQDRFRDNPVLNHSYDFSLQIINYCEELNDRKKFIIANQLFRSGTSIGANIFEAQNAESKNDFIHKMKVAAKEIEETKYWLLLCSDSSNYPSIGSLAERLDILAKLVGKIIVTTIRNKTV